MEKVHFLLVSVIVAFLWLLFAGELAAAEIMAALVAGFVTATGGKVLRKRTGHRQGGLKLWVRFFPRLFVQAIKDSWVVSMALCRQLAGKQSQGRFRRLSYQKVTDEPEDIKMRVVATVGTTLQPNSYVLGFNKERKEVLIHQLVPTQDHPIEEEIRKSE